MMTMAVLVVLASGRSVNRPQEQGGVPSSQPCFKQICPDGQQMSSAVLH